MTRSVKTALCLAAAAAVAFGGWTQWAMKRPAPREPEGAAVAMLSGRLVVVGGAAGTQVYDIPHDKWIAGPTLPVPLAHGAFAETARGLEIFGGHDGALVSRAIWRLEANERFGWSDGGKAPADTLHGRAARTGDRTYIFGGCASVTDFNSCSDKVWMRVRNGAWRQAGALPHGAVAMMASAVVGPKVYFFGGVTAAGNRADAFEFDAAANSWRRLADLPRARRSAAAAASNGGQVYILGGSADSGPLDEVLLYDARADRYTPGPPLPRPAGAAAFARRGDMLVGVGGGRTFILR